MPTDVWEPNSQWGALAGTTQHRFVLKHLPVAAYTCDADGLVTFFNQRAAELWGREPRLHDAADRFCGSFRLLLPDGSPIAVEECWMARALREGREYSGEEIVIERPDGSRRTALAHATPFRDARGRVSGAVNVLVDVTAQKRAEAAVRATDERFRAFMDNSPAVAFVKDAAGRYLFTNETLHLRFGVRPGCWLGRTDADIFPAEVAGRVAENDRAVLAGTVAVRLEEVVPTPDGTARHWLVFKFPFTNAAGERLLGGMAVDITEHKEALRGRDESLALLDTLLNGAPLGVAFLDRGLRYVRINPTLAAMNGHPPEAHLGRTLLEMVPQFAPQLEPLYRQVLATGEVIKDLEMSGPRPDAPKKTGHWLTSYYPVRGPGGQVLGVGTVVLDVTEKKSLEHRLNQSQKMEVVGQLAGGVAHDFNNLLTIISGYSDLMLDRLTAADPERALVQEIHKAGERAAGLTRQLLAFSRKQLLEQRVLDLNAVVADTEKMLRRLIGEDVIMSTALAPGLWRVKADAGQVEQVIMNLAVNARDAMPRGGRLTIETMNADLDEAFAEARPEVTAGRYAMIAVSDTGCGMTPEVQAHVFEPFFTTKEAGKGTGLGLATVYGIVKQSGGYIYLHSEAGRGTTFKVYLPAVEEAVTVGHPVPGSQQTTAVGTETILLVEDDDAVRAMTRFALRSFGYTVLEASRGEEAVRLAEGYEGSIHLLLTDVVMPGLSGRQLVDRVRAARPGVRVLYLSGYTDDAVVRHGILEAEVNFLQKPYPLRVLARKVREVLDR